MEATSKIFLNGFKTLLCIAALSGLSACGKHQATRFSSDQLKDVNTENTTTSTAGAADLIADQLAETVNKLITGQLNSVTQKAGGPNKAVSFSESRPCPLGGTVSVTGNGDGDIVDTTASVNLASQSITFNSCVAENPEDGSAMTINGTLNSKSSQANVQNVNMQGAVISFNNGAASGDYTGTLSINNESDCTASVSVNANAIEGNISLATQGGTMSFDASVTGSACDQNISRTASRTVNF